MLKCCGYDLLVQVDERLINKALAGIFYSGALKKTGTYSFIEGIPEELRGFTQAEYSIKLRNEPYLEFLKEATAGLRVSVEVILKVLGGVRIELDADFGACTEMHLDKENGRLKFDLKQSNIYDLQINDHFECHKNVIDRMNQIIKILIKQYLENDVKEISLPVSIINLDLPDCPGNRISVKIQEVLIADGRYLYTGVNFFGHIGGNPEGICDMAKGAGLAVALKVDALKSIAGFWWERTEHEKKTDFNGALPINARKVLAKGKDLFLRAITLGILQPDSEVNNAVLVYNGIVELLELPEISFENENRVLLDKLKLKVNLHAHLHADVRNKVYLDSSGLIPDQLTPWTDDKLLHEENKSEVFLNMDEVIMLEIERAVCEIHTDDKNRLVIKVVEADLELDFGNKWYQNFTERIMNAVLDSIERTILGKIPPIVISPSLLLSDIEIRGYTFGVEITEIELSAEELVAAVNMTVNELSENAVPVPLYIGNRNSMKLHRFDCEVVEDIDFTHRIGYHGVFEAVKDGYKPCGECLKGYPLQNN